MREYSMLRARRVHRAPFELAAALERDAVELALERAHLTDEELIDLAADPSIVTLAPTIPTRLVAPVGAATRPTEAPGWGIDAVQASASPYDGSGVVVSVIDTGIDSAHPAFAGVHLVEHDFTGSGARDEHGHGTHCAGVLFGHDVDGTRIGVARGVARALVAKALDTAGRGRSDWLQEALLWAGREGAHVILLSIVLDFPGTVAERLAEGLPPDAATAVALVQYRANVCALEALLAVLRTRPALRRAPVVVAASGNESCRDARPPRVPYRAYPGAPASLPEVLTTGALVERATGLMVAPFSSTHAQLCAPGVEIPSARPGGGLTVLSGTTMAAAHAAGIAALWWQHLGAGCDAALLMAHLRAACRKGVFASTPDAADVGSGIVTSPQ